jgi:hypothetical protein
MPSSPQLDQAWRSSFYVGTPTWRKAFPSSAQKRVRMYANGDLPSSILVVCGVLFLLEIFLCAVAFPD